MFNLLSAKLKSFYKFLKTIKSSDLPNNLIYAQQKFLDNKKDYYCNY